MGAMSELWRDWLEAEVRIDMDPIGILGVIVFLLIILNQPVRGDAMPARKDVVKGGGNGLLIIALIIVLIIIAA